MSDCKAKYTIAFHWGSLITAKSPDPLYIARGVHSIEAGMDMDAAYLLEKN